MFWGSWNDSACSLKKTLFQKSSMVFSLPSLTPAPPGLAKDHKKYGFFWHPSLIKNKEWRPQPILWTILSLLLHQRHQRQPIVPEPLGIMHFIIINWGRNFTPIWTWIYPPGRPSFLKTSCFEMTLQSLYYKSLTVRKSEWIPTSWQCKILARWNIRTKVLCISFGFFCIMWDLLLAFHAYIRQPEIYGEESIIFLNRKLKKI